MSRPTCHFDFDLDSNVMNLTGLGSIVCGAWSPCQQHQDTVLVLTFEPTFCNTELGFDVRAGYVRKQVHQQAHHQHNERCAPCIYGIHQELLPFTLFHRSSQKPHAAEKIQQCLALDGTHNSCKYTHSTINQTISLGHTNLTTLLGSQSRSYHTGRGGSRLWGA